MPGSWAVLAIAVATVLAGARSLAAIGEWAAHAPEPVLAALGVRRDPLTGARRPPGGATVRRVLARIDSDALDLVIGQCRRTIRGGVRGGPGAERSKVAAG